MPGQHHLIVEVAEARERADQKLRSMNIGDRVPCFSPEGAFGDGMYGLFGIQLLMVASTTRRAGPRGVR